MKRPAKTPGVAEAYDGRRAAYAALGATPLEAAELALHESAPVSPDRLAALRARRAQPDPGLRLDAAGRHAYEEAYRRRNEY